MPLAELTYINEQAGEFWPTGGLTPEGGEHKQNKNQIKSVK